jgi:glycosyltransferase involved in cell wall biosynthesis
MMPAAFFLLPGSIERRTGGSIYDRRIVKGLRAIGWHVTVRELDPSFPFPGTAARRQAVEAVSDIPDDQAVLIDGLAFGALPEEVGGQRDRLRLVALVHHPLAFEVGLGPHLAGALRASERQALLSARHVVVTSLATSGLLVDAYDVDRLRVSIVEPGTDHVPLAAGSRARALHLLSVGSLTPRKGHRVLFSALARLKALDWQLNCVGSDDRDRQTSAELRAMIRHEGLEDRVVLAGAADEQRMQALYDEADVFVLSTLYEGYGMAVAEALARGLPVVSTPTGGIPGLLQLQADRPAGILVPPGDVNALTLALERVLVDRVHLASLAEGARQARTRLRGWDEASADMAAVLQRVLSSG